MAALYLLLFLLFLFITEFTCVGDFESMSGSKNSKNYGPYNVIVKDFQICKGPKSVTLTNILGKLVIEKNAYVIYVNVTVLKSAHVDEVKIIVHRSEVDRNVSLWTYKAPNPCKHFALSAMINQILDTKSCIITKGHHYFKLDITKYTSMYLGTSFFYGEYIYKAYVLSKSGNISCYIINSVFEKKLKE